MKKAAETQVYAEPRGRFTGWGVLGIGVGLALVTFLVIGPFVERNAHLEALHDLQDQERLKRGLLVLCNTEGNIPHLNAQLEGKSLAERNRVTPVAQELGCMERLRPVFQAEYHLWHGSRERGVSDVVAQGEVAVEPAIAALNAPEAEVRQRAQRVLLAMVDNLSTDQIGRIMGRLKEVSGEGADVKSARELRVSLSSRLPQPAVVEEEPVKRVGDEERLGVDPSVGASDVVDAALERAREAAEGDDVELGGGGLRLRLDLMGMGAGVEAQPRARRVVPSGILYQRDDEREEP